MRNEHKLIWKSRNISVNKQGKGKIQGKASVTGPAESHKSQCSLTLFRSQLMTSSINI
jgi:hypothetical protein